jgi:hypothetical protein
VKLPLPTRLVLACAIVESSSRKARVITQYYFLILDFYIEFVWLGTREDAARHLHTLIKPSTFDHQRWMKGQKSLSLTAMVLSLPAGRLNTMNE